ncbi:hypothetical protein FGO68_gene9147 [Halteria grandinella]|uniref:Uncharacterized protein n=1 Tax=Halteria grandinella TaxID=5974 RepID=A0A8J8NW35_HALGN|nr:hypothetical protein FGO68_gene9147 [Halteria grandinella]
MIRPQGGTSKPIFGLISPSKTEQTHGLTEQVNATSLGLDLNRAKRQLFGDDRPTEFFSSQRKNKSDSFHNQLRLAQEPQIGSEFDNNFKPPSIISLTEELKDPEDMSDNQIMKPLRQFVISKEKKSKPSSKQGSETKRQNQGAVSDASNIQGRWSKTEHEKFIEAIFLFGKEWKKVEKHIGTRCGAQIRSHAQKFFNRMEEEGNVDVDAYIKQKALAIIDKRSHSAEKVTIHQGIAPFTPGRTVHFPDAEVVDLKKDVIDADENLESDPIIKDTNSKDIQNLQQQQNYGNVTAEKPQVTNLKKLGATKKLIRLAPFPGDKSHPRA